MPRQNVSVNEHLISYKEVKNEKEMLYMLLAQIQNLQISYVYNEHGLCGSYVMCRAMQGKIPYRKDIVDECICFSYFSSWLVYAYKKSTISSFIFLYFLFFDFPQIILGSLKINYIQAFKNIILSSFRTYILLYVYKFILKL